MSMQAFVRGRNGRAGKDENGTTDKLEHLKMPVPALDNTDPDHASTAHLTQTVELPKATSKTGSAGRYEAIVPKDVPGKSETHAKSDVRHLNADDLAGFDDIDDFEIAAPVSADDRIEKLKRKKLQEIKQARLTDKYIEGDSYPDTTSGKLTDDDFFAVQLRSDPYAAIQDTLLQAEYQKAAPPPRFKHADSSLVKPVQSRAERSYGLYSSPPRAGAQPVRMPHSTQPLKVFGRPAELSMEPPVFQSSPRQTQAKKRSHPQEEPQPQATAYQTAGPRATRAMQQPASINVRQDTTVQRDVMLEPSSKMHNNLQGIQVSVPASLLDHDLEQLHDLQYEQLKAESFDQDPRNKHTSSKITLDVNSPMDDQQWSEHFHSLNINEWEDAGQWFIEQFSGTLAKIRAIRQERRDVAKLHEQEIEERHSLIIKKRIALRNTLQDMRLHGAQVLDQAEHEQST